MAEGSARWTYDEETRAWYFALNERAAGSYSTQIKVAAILDLDDEGRLRESKSSTVNPTVRLSSRPKLASPE